jgi:hypothetical protein
MAFSNITDFKHDFREHIASQLMAVDLDQLTPNGTLETASLVKALSIIEETTDVTDDLTYPLYLIG